MRLIKGVIVATLVVFVAVTMFVGGYLPMGSPPMPTNGEDQPSELAVPVTSEFPVRAAACVLVESASGQELVNVAGDESRHPASLVKIMTMKLALEAVAAERVSLDTTTTVGREAWRAGQGTSSMFLKEGQTVSVDELLHGIAVASGNDACVALAELLSGSEQLFVERMNERAQQLGLTGTHFVNSHGLTAEGQLTTARDMAILARAFVQDHPAALGDYMAVKEYTFNGIKQYNRNGLKTGYTTAAHYNLVATAERDGMRLIAVILGAEPTPHQSGESVREEEGKRLLNFGFHNFASVHVADQGQELARARVWKGSQNYVPAVAAGPVTVVVPAQRGHQHCHDTA